MPCPAERRAAPSRPGPAAEQAAGASSASSTSGLAALFKAIDSNGDNSLSSSEVSAFADKLGTALEQLVSDGSNGGSGSGSGDRCGQSGKDGSGSNSATGSTTSSTSTSTNGSGFDISKFASMVMRQYSDLASGFAVSQGNSVAA